MDNDTWSDKIKNASKCPTCQVLLDGATGNDPKGPQPGTVSICVYCGEFLQFTDTLGLDLLPEETFKEFSEDYKEFLLSLRIRVMKKIGEHSKFAPPKA